MHCNGYALCLEKAEKLCESIFKRDAGAVCKKVVRLAGDWDIYGFSCFVTEGEAEYVCCDCVEAVGFAVVGYLWGFEGSVDVRCELGQSCEGTVV